MFKLERIIQIIFFLMWNLCYVTASFSDFINLLKIVDAEQEMLIDEIRIDCVQSISKPGVYTFKSDPRLPFSKCDITLEVPDETIAYVRPSERTCETTSSTNISNMCDRPMQEEQLYSGHHHFLFDASESVTIHVQITPIFRLGCAEWAKNVYSLSGHTIILENNLGSKYCMVQMPASLEITWINYETTNRKKPCCPDVFVASTDFAENPVGYSDSFNACEMRANQETYITRCEMTYIYFRQSAKHDKLIFRIKPRHKKHIDECIPVPEELEPSNFTCIKKPKPARNRSKLTFL
ncbi:Insulin/EGF-Receptor L Domain protein [Caenorhabditis elegans]|uniref:Insulin/EGF-Receptor L Domain protein n=1 Tax=Caenorhabditis elegans TaxID=6239 RepID=Q18349_CAEEL|nr:Insulin/EGF-Receptor L Domain protein [Caenorhabditis elegans]CAA89022.1 Insulin/EGF-Receptor L Domain protein [Caenorhabditis elegans]|eukprot:NP_509722.1 Uncharacterized protein CELE_C32A9.1 [Caenorhabditis elegans]